MKLLYAVRDFDALITEGYLYIDRTDRIPVLESLGKELLLLRPRRFGKSLWLSTLMNYYDVAKAADFARLFGKRTFLVRQRQPLSTCDVKSL